MEKKIIYLDNAATTKPFPEVVKVVNDFCEDYYNPSSLYTPAFKARNAIENVRKMVARKINAEPHEIYFTSGGTESDNWALKGNLKPGDHLITSKIEHHAILRTAEFLERNGVEVTYLNVNKYGFIDIDQLEKEIKDNTALISIMSVNNEIGTIQDIDKIGEIAHKHNIKFHTDAVQAMCHIPIDVKEMNIDMLSASAHKFGGIKGTGFLYVKDGLISPFILGGGQENEYRAGTENVPGIMAMGKAIELSKYYYDIQNIRNYFAEEILDNIDGAIINNPLCKSLPNCLSMRFEGIKGEELAGFLDLYNICVSTGSACNSKYNQPSHVLKAIGLSDEEANSTIRFSLGFDFDKNKADYVVHCLEKSIRQLKTVQEY